MLARCPSDHRAPSRHLLTTPRLCLQSVDQLNIEEGQREERASVHDDEVQQVCVEDTVDLVMPEVAQFEDHFRSVVSVTFLDLVVLEETRDIVDDGKQSHDAYQSAGLTIARSALAPARRP